MTELLIKPARETGCSDLPALEEAVQEASERQHSPLDDILDTGLVDEEPYMRELATGLYLDWLPEIPDFESALPLRAACGPQIALKHRVLPIEIDGKPPHAVVEAWAGQAHLVHEMVRFGFL